MRLTLGEMQIPMKHICNRKHAFGFLLIIVSVALVTTPSPASSTTTTAEPTPQLIEFGTIRPDEAVFKVVELKNNSTNDIVIRKIMRSCGCIAATTDRDRLAPGQIGHLKLEISGRGYAEDLQTTVLIEVGSDASQWPQWRFTLRAHVAEVIALDAGGGAIDLGEVSQSDLPSSFKLLVLEQA